MASVARSVTFIVFTLTGVISNVSWAVQEQPVRSMLELRREHVVVQEWDISCGAAALATLLKYQHGDDVTERQVAVALMSRPEYMQLPEIVRARQGFSLLDLKRYADARGYKGIGYGKLELEHLLQKAPIIVSIQTHGYNHFVVFRGMLGNRVLLADPAWGNRTMLATQFLDSWIDYAKLGKIGFIVARQDGQQPPNRLHPRATEFVLLR